MEGAAATATATTAQSTAQSTAIEARNPPPAAPPPPPLTSSSQSFPPHPPPSSAAANSNSNSITRKRPLENDSLSHNNSKRLKLRLLFKGLRPHFLQVLQTPEFRNCKAANEIQEQMKFLVELYKQVITETDSVVKKIATESRPSLPSENKNGQNPQEKASAETSDITGTYVVGGSAFGWNFITFTAKDPVYYGVTKETFRARATKATP